MRSDLIWRHEYTLLLIFNSMYALVFTYVLTLHNLNMPWFLSASFSRIEYCVILASITVLSFSIYVVLTPSIVILAHSTCTISQ